MSLTFDKELEILPIVKDAAAKYNVPSALILAHIKQESNFDPNAYRAEPAIGDASTGLMQVLLGTAKQFSPDATEEEMYDPAFNIDIGTAYIAKNLARYNGNVQDAIAAYNAGTARKNADGKYVNSQGVTNVQSYVDKVYANFNNYSSWIASGASEIDVGTTVAQIGSEITSIDPTIALVLGALCLGTVVFVWKNSTK